MIRLTTILALLLVGCNLHTPTFNYQDAHTDCFLRIYVHSSTEEKQEFICKHLPCPDVTEDSIDLIVRGHIGQCIDSKYDQWEKWND